MISICFRSWAFLLFIPRLRPKSNNHTLKKSLNALIALKEEKNNNKKNTKLSIPVVTRLFIDLRQHTHHNNVSSDEIGCFLSFAVGTCPESRNVTSFAALLLQSINSAVIIFAKTIINL